MNRRQKKKQEKKRLAKMGIFSQKEIQKQRLKEAKRAARERRKGIPTRKAQTRIQELNEALAEAKELEEAKELAKEIADSFLVIEEETIEEETIEEKEESEVDDVGIYDYDFFAKFGGAQTPGDSRYPHILELFFYNDGSPEDWDHVFTEKEIAEGKGSGFEWARGNLKKYKEK